MSRWMMHDLDKLYSSFGNCAHTGTRVPNVVNECIVIAARFQQHLSLTILGLS